MQKDLFSAGYFLHPEKIIFQMKAIEPSDYPKALDRHSRRSSLAMTVAVADSLIMTVGNREYREGAMYRHCEEFTTKQSSQSYPRA